MLKRVALAAGFLMALAGLALGNDFYTHGNFPAPSSPFTSASMRAEFDLISAGFAKLPTLAGNANKVVIINGGATGLTTTAGQLSLAGNFTITGAFNTTFAQSASITLTLPGVSGTLATLDGIEILTNKTLLTPSITAPNGLLKSDVGLSNVDNTSDATKNAAVATLTNKTLTTPIINGGTLSGTFGGALLIPDNVLLIAGSADATKKLAFEVDGFTTSTTHTVTFPDANLTFPEVTTAGDTLITSSSGVLARLAVGSAGSIPMSRAAATNKVAYVAALNKVIYGLTYANNAGDATNDLDIAAGGAMDATGAYFMVGAIKTKQTDANWAVGTAAGCLDTGAVGNSDYYIWIIVRSDTGVVDYLCSLSSTAPTMPANYDFKQLFGWVKRTGGTIVAFHTYETEGGGLELQWDSPTTDVNLSNTLTTSRRTDAVKVPLNFSVLAHLAANTTDASSAFYAIIYSPDQGDLVPNSALANMSMVGGFATGATNDLRIRTSATGTVAARANIATVDAYVVSTLGFTWARRN